MSKDTMYKIIVSAFIPYHAKKLAIFGSFARGEQTEKSDIDILVDFSEPISLFDLGGLYEEIKEKTGRDVDIVTYRSISPLIRERVLAEQHIIYEK